MPTLTQAYQSELKRTRHAVADRVAANWHRLPDLRDERIPGFLAATLPVVKAGQGRAVALTSAYLSKKLGVAPVHDLRVDAIADVRAHQGLDIEANRGHAELLRQVRGRERNRPALTRLHNRQRGRQEAGDPLVA